MGGKPSNGEGVGGAGAAAFSIGALAPSTGGGDGAAIVGGDGAAIVGGDGADPSVGVDGTDPVSDPGVSPGGGVFGVDGADPVSDPGVSPGGGVFGVDGTDPLSDPGVSPGGGVFGVDGADADPNTGGRPGGGVFGTIGDFVLGALDGLEDVLGELEIEGDLEGRKDVVGELEIEGEGDGRAVMVGARDIEGAFEPALPALPKCSPTPALPPTPMGTRVPAFPPSMGTRVPAFPPSMGTRVPAFPPRSLRGPGRTGGETFFSPKTSSPGKSDPVTPPPITGGTGTSPSPITYCNCRFVNRLLLNPRSPRDEAAKVANAERMKRVPLLELERTFIFAFFATTFQEPKL